MMKRLLFCLITTFSCQLAISQSISSNSPLCSDSSPTLELKATGGSTYAWTGPNSFTSNQQNPVINKATTSNAGTYTCVVDGKTILTINVKVGRIDNPLFAYYYTTGARLVLYTSTDDNLFTYLWTGPNGFSSTKRFNYIDGYGKANQGFYSVIAKDEFGCVQNSQTNVRFSNPDCPYSPVIYARTKSGGGASWGGTGNTFTVNTCEGTNIIFSADTTFWGKNVTLQWFKDDKIIPNATALEYATKELGTYYVQIYKGTCTYTTHKIKPVFTNGNLVLNLDNVGGKPREEKFICKKGGSTSLYYYNENTFLSDEQSVSQWYKDGVAIPRAIYSNFTATEEGNYQVRVKSGQCEALSKAVAVKAVDKLKPIFNFYANGELSEKQRTLKLCNENANLVQINVAGDGEKKVYRNGTLWQQNSFSNNYYSVPTQSATYILETKQGECSSSDTLKLELGNTVDVFTTKYEYLTCNNPTNFYYNLAGPGSNYNFIKWYKNDALFSTGSSLFPNSSAIYQGKYENASTGCKGETEKINVAVPASPSRQFFKVTSPLTKNVTLCKNIKENRQIQINTSINQGVWKKDGKTHDAGNSTSRTSVSQAGKYWYEYTNSQCTNYSDTVVVVEEELPKMTLTQTCIKDNSVKLNVNASSGVKYNWFQNGVALSAKDTTLTVSQGGKYMVETYKNSCFASSNEVNVGVYLPETINICNGDSLKLKSNSEILPTYNWTGPNNFKSNLQNPTIAKSNKGFQGFYKIAATDKSGCNFNAQTQVIINDYPAFTLPKTITACAGSEFIFNQLISKPLTDSTETVGYYYAIAPNKNSYYGNFSFNNITNNEAGIYNVTVVGSQEGCSVKTTTEIIVDATADCRSISLTNRNSKGICPNQESEIEFKTTGTFKAGTNFNAFYEESYISTDGVKIRKVILGTGKQSPIKIKGLKSGGGSSIRIESEDGVRTAFSQYVYAFSTSSNAVVDATDGNRNAECSVLPLRLSNSGLFTKIQWFFNGDTLRKETNNSVNASKTGNYTIKYIDNNNCSVSFSKDVTIGKLDKPSLYGNKLNELNCFTESSYLSTNYSANRKYTWRRDGILQTETGSSIQATTAGKYTVEVSKESCKAVSDTIVVKQNTNRKLNFQVYAYSRIDTVNNNIGYISADYLGESIYKYQIFKDNQLFAEGRNSQVFIKEPGKYFYKVSKGDCDAVSNIVDFKTVPTSKENSSGLYFNGNYDYSTKTIQLCDTNSIQSFYGYPSQYSTGTVVKRVITAFRDNKPLPTFKDGENVYPSLRYNANDYNFYLYFRGIGTYHVIEELTLKDSTKLKNRYGDLTVVTGTSIRTGSSIPQSIFSCSDSVSLYGYNYSNGQRPVSIAWKKDNVVFKKGTELNVTSLVVKQAGTYVLETTYKGGCISLSTPYKVELSKLGVGIDTTSRIICEGTSISLSVNNLQGFNGNDTTKINYQWQKDGKDYLQEKGSFVGYNYYGITLSTKEAGVYTLKMQQSKCQGISQNINIKADNVPNSINYADSVSFCQTQIVNLKTTEDATLSYLWERDGGFIKDANKATLEVKEAGIYRSLNRKGACWNYTPKVRAKILANILPTAILTGDKEINYADTTKVSIAFTSHAPWTFRLSDGKDYTATKSPFEVSLRPQFSTNYTLTEVKNVCGAGAISGTANIKVLVLSSELEQGIDLNVFPVPSKEDVNIQLVLDKPEAMEWTLNSTFGNVLMSESQPNKRSKHESIVSLKTLPEGVYFLRIQAGEKSLVRKIIKSN